MGIQGLLYIYKHPIIIEQILCLDCFSEPLKHTTFLRVLGVTKA